VPAQFAPLSSFRIVADDLSGAADCAASFAGVAGPVPVALDANLDAGACCAVDTDSRALPHEEAVALTTRLFACIAAAASSPALVYKKIDSTLRGHVGAELAAALAAARGFAGAIVAPAFPEQGRSFAGGKLLVHGRAPDGLDHTGDLMAMLDAARLRPALLSLPFDDAQVLALRIQRAGEAGARAIAIDASTQGDLLLLAAALRQLRAPWLVAGSAGLARALAQHVEPGASGVAAPAPVSCGAVLTLVGSFSPASAAQVRAVEAAGDARIVRLAPSQWQHEAHAPLRRTAVDAAQRDLAAGRHVLFAIDGDVVQPFSRSLVRAMARTAAPLLPLARACVLTGGDTARALFDVAGIARLDVAGELEAGISIGHAPAQPGRVFVLKAGGFGDAGALQRAIRRFGVAA
jgi:uncharacterized protein YgbK (DUF1537 family)